MACVHAKAEIAWEKIVNRELEEFQRCDGLGIKFALGRGRRTLWLRSKVLGHPPKEGLEASSAYPGEAGEDKEHERTTQRENSCCGRFTCRQQVCQFRGKLR